MTNIEFNENNLGTKFNMMGCIHVALLLLCKCSEDSLSKTPVHENVYNGPDGVKTAKL